MNLYQVLVAAGVAKFSTTRVFANPVLVEACWYCHRQGWIELHVERVETVGRQEGYRIYNTRLTHVGIAKLEEVRYVL